MEKRNKQVDNRQENQTDFLFVFLVKLHLIFRKIKPMIKMVERQMSAAVSELD